MNPFGARSAIKWIVAIVIVLTVSGALLLSLAAIALFEALRAFMHHAV